jgi:hypothetical protein
MRRRLLRLDRRTCCLALQALCGSLCSTARLRCRTARRAFCALPTRGRIIAFCFGMIPCRIVRSAARLGHLFMSVHLAVFVRRARLSRSQIRSTGQEREDVFQFLLGSRDAIVDYR